MHKKVLVLPVDARPVVCSQLKYLGALAGWDVILPPVKFLGFIREIADRDALREWVLGNAPNVDGFVLSLDTLMYGGLIASRISGEDMQSLSDRLACSREIKSEFPKKPIYGSLTTMRISNSNINEEEKEYWDKYGERIWEWSFYADKYKVHGDELDNRRSRDAQNKIPETIRTDYLQTRYRNFEIAKTIINGVVDGIFDRLILPQDDNAQYGFNISETRRLKALIKKHGLAEKILVYSGADEVAWTLLSHLISKLEDRASRKVYLSWHFPEDAKSLVPRYENQPIGVAARNQLLAAGAQVAQSVDQADVILAIHTARQRQGDWALQIPLQSRYQLRKEWITGLRRRESEGTPIAFADLAYANGGDPKFFDLMLDQFEPRKIAGYGAWNTASNSLGTLAAQIQIRSVSDFQIPQLQLLAFRLLDDAFYQAKYRQVIRDKIGLSPPRETDRIELEQAAQQWLTGKSLSFIRLREVVFPWARTFEAGFSSDISFP
ncbi:MAG: DUF4127 family protein [Hyphomonadaceae bacterium]|nr:DUF4127 family protein [Hyphomonadaceae bacterium]MBC6412627.1 DUF4127 family protein [Hyphomonadaceae bacterium]